MADGQRSPIQNGVDLKAIRGHLGLGQSDLAGLLGVSRETIVRWEKGGNASPPVLLEALAEAFRLGLLPTAVDRSSRWGWWARLFDLLHRSEVPVTADDVLAAIERLDRERGARNRLPIFVLREHYAGVVSRENLDRLLMQLMRDGRLRMSTLQEGHLYSREQYEAGIPSVAGGPRFFLVVER